MKSIAVYCGSGDGYNELYREQAYETGRMLAERGLHVIYGGAKIGLMGAVADGVLNNNGQITGVIPDFLRNKELMHESLTDMVVVSTMHQRKLVMYERCDAILVLPGGWGTMDEMFEMLTWGQLGMHTKPIGLLNINGYYDALKALNTTMVQEGFLGECARSILMFSDSLPELLDKMETYEAPDLPQVINKQTT
ncbi:MAG: TIGR00730 family Rossman fold protein [Taibaiella sp.]|nr:TIGR00730 family Rossman fold protein [Taibaiella sp.]